MPRFYHCNRRHHSLALARAPFELPQQLHHVMVETNSRDDVGAAFHRAWDSGLPIPNGLGRHDEETGRAAHIEVGYRARVMTAPTRHWIT